MTDREQALQAQIEARRPLVVSYGGGVNSTAVLVGYAERGIVPDAIVFANTGGEKPETYDTIREVSEWCIARGMPGITVVRRPATERAPYTTLEQECVETRNLPSRAYGFSRCASKWKVDPFISWAKSFVGDGQVLHKAVGFHADEQRRVKPDPRDWVVNVYPLIEWGWDQRACRDAILRSGLTMPVKSACFFCPSSSRREVARLARERPDLFARSVAIEHAADAKMREIVAADPNFDRTVIGLGRNWTWESVGNAAVAQCQLVFDDVGESLPCGCHDGGDEDDDD